MGSYVVTVALDEHRLAARMARLLAAGLTEAAAQKVARYPAGGPVILAPGVVVSLFALRADGTSVLSPDEAVAS